jgi:hypothetical protein
MDHSLDHSLEEPLGWGPFHSQTGVVYDDRATAAQYRTRAPAARRAPQRVNGTATNPTATPPRSTRIQLTLYTK